jgi:hypothetical protein
MRAAAFSVCLAVRLGAWVGGGSQRLALDEFASPAMPVTWLSRSPRLRSPSNDPTIDSALREYQSS